jgi:hypothetical protein
VFFGFTGSKRAPWPATERRSACSKRPDFDTKATSVNECGSAGGGWIRSGWVGSPHGPARRVVRVERGCPSVARLRHKSGARLELKCRGQDSNLGTPSRADLESAAFGHSATPARSPLQGGRLILLPLPRPRRPAYLRRARGPHRPPSDVLGSGPDRRRAFGPGSPFAACARTRGRPGSAGPNVTGSGPCVPRSSTPSILGSRALGTPEGTGRCSASRSGVPVGRTGGTGRCDPRGIRPPPAQRGR